MSTKLNIINFIKVEFMPELFAIDCTGIPNKVTTERMSH